MKIRDILALSTAMLLCCSVAFAETTCTVQDLLAETAGGWHETYEAHRRTIQVDLDIRVPNVSAFPVLHLTFEDMPETRPADGQEMSYYFPEEWRYGIQDQGHDDSDPDDKHVSQKNGDTFLYPDEPDRIYPTGGTMTLGEVIETVRSNLETYGNDPSDWQLDAPYLLQTYSYHDKKTGETVFPGVYYAFFHQKICGIPILDHAGHAHLSDPHWISPQVSAWITKPDSFEVSVEWQLKEDACLAEDVPLMPFSKIKSIVEEKILDGHIRKVIGMELGYMIYTDPVYRDDTIRRGHYDYVGHYYAVPVWQVQCWYAKDAGTKLDKRSDDVDVLNVREFRNFIIHAQTGKILNSDDYPGFVQ